MKRCSCCRELKSENEFYKNPRHKDGLQSCCKVCSGLMGKGLKVGDIRKILAPKLAENVGGYRINILKHAKSGEFKFNLACVGTGGKNLNTNDKELFKARFDELINQF